MTIKTSVVIRAIVALFLLSTMAAAAATALPILALELGLYLTILPLLMK
jgi:hypothetical protein